MQIGLHKHRRWFEISDLGSTVVDGLYYLCRENKGVDQLHSYRAGADLCLCFGICKKQVFS